MTELADLDADEKLELKDPRRLNRLRGYGLEQTLSNHIMDLIDFLLEDFVRLSIIEYSVGETGLKPILDRMVSNGKLVYGKNSYSTKTRKEMREEDEKAKIESARDEAEREAMWEAGRLAGIGV